MILFIVEITAADIALYMSAHFLPEYFQNMKLEDVVFHPEALNWNGTQPLVLTYTVPGRVEDFEMTPQKHAFPIIRSVHPFFDCEKVSFVPASALWTWDHEKMRIFFQPKELKSEASGEVFSAEDAYISISRQQIFLSFEVLQEYLAQQTAELGLDVTSEFKRIYENAGMQESAGSAGSSSLRWDDSLGGIIYRTENITVQLVFSEENALYDILRFLGLDTTLRQLETWVKPALDEAQISKIQITETGIKIPLQVRMEVRK